MLKVSAAEFQRDVGRYQDLALSQPVAVTRNGRDSWVLLSADEYNRLERRDRRVFTIEEMTKEDAALVAKSEVPPGFEHLDDELKDWAP